MVYLGKPSLVFDILFSQVSECLEGEDKAQIWLSILWADGECKDKNSVPAAARTAEEMHYVTLQWKIFLKGRIFMIRCATQLKFI